MRSPAYHELRMGATRGIGAVPRRSTFAETDNFPGSGCCPRANSTLFLILLICRTNHDAKSGTKKCEADPVNCGPTAPLRNPGAMRHPAATILASGSARSRRAADLPSRARIEPCRLACGVPHRPSLDCGIRTVGQSEAWVAEARLVGAQPRDFRTGRGALQGEALAESAGRNAGRGGGEPRVALPCPAG